MANYPLNHQPVTADDTRTESLGVPAACRTTSARRERFLLAPDANRSFHPQRSGADEAYSCASRRSGDAHPSRIAFDLTGLPPTPEEIQAFVYDESPDAFAKLVERLLASPRYGERWGRHWLDVARYADSNGLDENVGQANAWRYRDYVINSFNADKPFDVFVREQLAGDLLHAGSLEQKNELLVATGFLSLGPKVLAEVDERKMEMDIVDEQIDTVGKSLLGLTLGCARCHDHKFDPIYHGRLLRSGWHLPEHAHHGFIYQDRGLV